MAEAPQVNVSLLGHPCSGKTTLIATANKKPFDEKYTPTRQSSVTVVNEANNAFHIYDTEGSLFLGDNRNSLKFGQDGWSTVDVFVIVYAANSTESFETAKAIKELVTKAGNAPFVLVSTKNDLPDKDKKITTADGKKLADEWNCPFHFVSGRDSAGIQGILQTITNQLVAASPRGLTESQKKRGLGARLMKSVGIKIPESKKPDALSPRSLGHDTSGEPAKSPRLSSGEPAKSPRLSFGGRKTSLSSSSKKNQVAVDWPKLEAENKDKDKDDLVVNRNDALSTETSDEFMSEHSEESKRKIRAARKRFEQQASGDGCWDQSKINVDDLRK